MKAKIHLIPTDKPSKLYSKDGNHKLDTSTMAMDWYISSAGYKPQNIYITSDEEIKEGDWYYDLDTKYVKIKQSWENSHLEFNSKKIILTTDVDLIKGGVQAVDDKFLEWFAKNPNCEEVVVGHGFIKLTETDNKGYWISIPDEEFNMKKQEPKQEMRKVCKCKRAYENPLSEICSLCWNELYPNEKDEIKDEDLLEPKQETLKEVKPKDIQRIIASTNAQTASIEILQLFTQLRAKTMYSEEDIREAFRQGQDNMDYSDTYGWTSKLTEQEWFEQFKQQDNQ